ncbi:hypothetical protein [Kineothrix sedimenti]|uniref:hypothetical protein n=1 Tax=Kineothrix sedimenti TaxID=3123317 RepID=UPI003CC8254E
MHLFSIFGAILFSLVAILTLLVTLGLPLGEFTLGGKYKILPVKMRAMSGISFILQLVAVFTILYAGDIIQLPFPLKSAKVICIVFAIYLLLNTGMNFLSNSKKEKYFMTPLALISSICFFVTAFSS